VSDKNIEKKQAEAIFFDLDGTLYNTFDTMAVLVDIADMYGKTYQVDKKVVFGLMRQSVDQYNFFTTDLSACVEELGPAVFKHSMLKVTNPEKAKAIEAEILKDNERRYNDNFVRKNKVGTDFTYKEGEKPVQMNKYQKDLANKYADAYSKFQDNVANCEVPSDKDYAVIEFMSDTSLLKGRVVENMVKRTSELTADNFSMFEGVVETLTKAKEAGTKIIALTDSSPMQMMINAVKAKLPGELFDRIYIRKKEGETVESVLPLVRGGKAKEFMDSIKDNTYYSDGWKPNGKLVLKVCDELGIDNKKVVFCGDSAKSDGGTAIQANELSAGKSDVVYAYARYGADVAAKAELAQATITNKEDYKIGVISHDTHIKSLSPKHVSHHVSEVEGDNGVKTTIVSLQSFNDINKYFEFVPAKNNSLAMLAISKKRSNSK